MGGGASKAPSQVQLEQAMERTLAKREFHEKLAAASQQAYGQQDTASNQQGQRALHEAFESNTASLSAFNKAVGQVRVPSSAAAAATARRRRPSPARCRRCCATRR